MSERYPDEYWLADFERRLHDGRLLTREESLGLIAELRRVRLERNELRAALEPLQIKLSQHHCTACAPSSYRRSRQEYDDMTRAYQELCARLDGAEDGDGLAPWRLALDG
jgi:hypothetical protein